MRIQNFFSPNIPLKTTRKEHIKGDFYSELQEFKPIVERNIVSLKNLYSDPLKVQVNREYVKELAKKKAQKYGVPVNIVLAIIEKESSFNVRAYNKNKDGTEDVGLMQINFQHNRRLMKEYGVNSPEELFDPDLNLELGVRILYENFKRYGSWELAVKAYNGIRADNWDYVKSVMEKAKKYVNL